MNTRWLTWGAPLMLAIVLALAPWMTARTTAQMGPMAGRSLQDLSGDEFDRAFLMQMTMHHAMAVMMARPVVVNAEHQELKDLAGSIIEDQTREIAQMRGWLSDWYGIDMPDPVEMMDRMHSGRMPMMPSGQEMPGHGGMPGHGTGKPEGMSKPGGMPMGQDMPMMHDMMMMHQMMMADLWKLPPRRLEVVFMSEMIPHHQSAIDMAGLVPDRAAHQELKDLAAQIIESQSAEIGQMNGWLSAWYGL